MGKTTAFINEIEEALKWKENNAKEVAMSVEEFLIKNDLHYHCKNQFTFTMNIETKNRWKKNFFIIKIDSLQGHLFFSLEPKEFYVVEARKAEVIQYITMVNHYIDNGKFVYDESNGEVKLVLYADFIDGTPSNNRIHAYFIMSFINYDMWMDGLLMVNFGILSSEEAMLGMIEQFNNNNL